MNKKLRLRRKIEKPDDKDEWVDESNMSPVACTECGRKYELLPGSSNARCADCNGRYKLTLGGRNDWHAPKWGKDG